MEHIFDAFTSRGAEAGGILGVNTLHFFGLTLPFFRVQQKMEVRGG